MSVTQRQKNHDKGARLSKTLVLVGMMGAGKTSVGRAVARSLGARFVDTDQEISQRAMCEIVEIFARDGEASFRRSETNVLKSLLARGPLVISTGGGTFISDENRALIAKAGISVYLRLDLETLWKRVENSKTRPLLQADDPYARLEEIFTARAGIYETADCALDVDENMSLQETSGRLLRLLLEEKLVK